MSFFKNLFDKGKQTTQHQRVSPEVKPLIARLANADASVRKAAADALVAIGAPAIDSLISVVESASWQSVQAAMWALGEIGDVRALETIATTLRSEKHKLNPNDKDQSVRQAAATALGKIGGARAIELLSSILNDKQDHRFVQMSVVKALEQIGTPQAIQAIGNSRWRPASKNR